MQVWHKAKLMQVPNTIWSPVDVDWLARVLYLMLVIHRLRNANNIQPSLQRKVVS